MVVLRHLEQGAMAVHTLNDDNICSTKRLQAAELAVGATGTD